MSVLLSLLIPTLERRRELFVSLQESLSAQIQAAGLENEIEILSSSDGGQKSLGAKRNELIEQASGEFVAFIDDDDMVSGDYVVRLADALRRRPDIDCIGFRGVITFRGSHPREFVHSLAYSDYFTRDGRYYRPPCHLNPIRRSIAERYRYAEVNAYEDRDWALRLRQDGALETEEFIDAVLYHYRSRGWWPRQWLLDFTEAPRRALGVNRSLRVGRYWTADQPATRSAVTRDSLGFEAPGSARPSLSVVIPVHNAQSTLRACLEAIRASRFQDFEVIVVDDASTDRSVEIARAFPCSLVTLETNAGPAAARNAGVAHSTGGILFFLDADILVTPQTLGAVHREITEHPERDALFGSFASRPAAGGFFTDYKNLLHHFTHQHSRPDAATFCSGFGAVRRRVFLALGGFDTRWRFLEDVEFGYRLHRSGYKTWLCKKLQFRHAKSYTLWGLLRSDLIGRAIPWTRLMMTHRIYRNDLNTRTHHLLSVPLAYALLLIPALWLSADSSRAYVPLLALFILLNRSFFSFVLRERGILFCSAAVVTCWLGYLVSGFGVVIGALAHCSDGLLRSRRLAPPEPEA